MTCQYTTTDDLGTGYVQRTEAEATFTVRRASTTADAITTADGKPDNGCGCRGRSIRTPMYSGIPVTRTRRVRRSGNPGGVNDEWSVRDRRGNGDRRARRTEWVAVFVCERREEGDLGCLSREIRGG